RRLSTLPNEDINAGKAPTEPLKELMNQCLNRDGGWKTYYDQQMAELVSAQCRQRLSTFSQLNVLLKKRFSLANLRRP
ncbi:MAG TPA: hypothetical protein VFP96_18255, partial [Candidatus Acidoferrum sp.]|nr:hypothetical protein [Candidatus Acidoferrum sp.]